MLLDNITNLINMHYSLKYYSKEPSLSNILLLKHLVPPLTELFLDSDYEEPCILFLKYPASPTLSSSPYVIGADNTSLSTLTEEYNTLTSESTKENPSPINNNSRSALHTPISKKKFSKNAEKAKAYDKLIS